MDNQSNRKMTNKLHYARPDIAGGETDVQITFDLTIQ